MSSEVDTLDHCCNAWEAVDSIIPIGIGSRPYQRFYIKIVAEFLYLKVDEDEDEDDEKDILDCLESRTREEEFEIPTERLTNPTFSCSTISDILTAVGVKIHIQPFMIHRISHRVHELIKGSRPSRSIIPMIVSLSVVVAEDEVDPMDDDVGVDDDDVDVEEDYDEPMDDDDADVDYDDDDYYDDDDDDYDYDDYDDARGVAASESAMEILKKLIVVEDEGEGRCMVCLEEIGVGCEATQMPCCHVYHHQCIVNWLRVSNLCPLCRYKLVSN